MAKMRVTEAAAALRVKMQPELDKLAAARAERDQAAWVKGPPPRPGWWWVFDAGNTATVRAIRVEDRGGLVVWDGGHKVAIRCLGISHHAHAWVPSPPGDCAPASLEDRG